MNKDLNNYNSNKSILKENFELNVENGKELQLSLREQILKLNK